MLEAEAKERQRADAAAKPRNEKGEFIPQVPISVQVADSTRAIDQAAKIVGASKTYVGDIKAIAKVVPGSVQGQTRYSARHDPLDFSVENGAALREGIEPNVRRVAGRLDGVQVGGGVGVRQTINTGCVIESPPLTP